MAENLLAIRKAEYIQGKYKIKNDKKGEVTFLKYYEQLKEERFETKANYGNWDAALKHIEKYCPAHKQLKDIDKLRWSEVRDEDTGSRIIFRQKKTDGLEYLYVSEQSRKLLGTRGSESDSVFLEA